MSIIASLSALEILDSRGRPTVRAICRLESGAEARASVPSGASTGAAEARELRDGDPKRYGGLGCRKAVENIRTEMHNALKGRRFEGQPELDRTLIELDGTPNKSRLGANAVLAVSLAFARATARENGVELCDVSPEGNSSLHLPRPTINLFSGGKHAGGQVAIQDVLIVPRGDSIDACLSIRQNVYYTAARRMQQRYGMRLLRADEGGLAPPFEDTGVMMQEAVEAIAAAGYKPGQDVALAVDVASSNFHSDGVYHLDGRRLDSDAMIQQVLAWVDRYPIVSVEDALAEEDWSAWPRLRGALADRVLCLGDDLLCTNPERIRRAVELNAASALLLKVNQIGTLTEAGQACQLARRAGWAVVASARSGETEDTWLADLAVGWGADQIKIGSITQSERLAKYNRLLEIESRRRLPLAPWR